MTSLDGLGQSAPISGLSHIQLLVSDVAVYSISVTHGLPVGKSLVQPGKAELRPFAGPLPFHR